MQQQITSADHIYARGLGIDLTDNERIRALQRERDAAFLAIDRLQGYLAGELQTAKKWRDRWMVTFGCLLGLVILDLVVMAVWWLQ